MGFRKAEHSDERPGMIDYDVASIETQLKCSLRKIVLADDSKAHMVINPFTHGDGDSFGVFIIKREEAYVITDLGDTVSHTAIGGEIPENVLSEMGELARRVGASFEKGILSFETTSSANVAWLVCELLGLMYAIDLVL